MCSSSKLSEVGPLEKLATGEEPFCLPPRVRVSGFTSQYKHSDIPPTLANVKTDQSLKKGLTYIYQGGTFKGSQVLC